MCKMTKLIIKLFLFLMFVLIIISYNSGLNQQAAYAAIFPLEITNIKPAGTGNPAIPATNRIFRAYPGIEYNIRAAVIGGILPYNFSLSNAPSGMTINSTTGEISWPNPQTNSGTITLSVTDAEKTTVITTWSIAVSTTGFYFIDSTKTVNGTGTINSPFNSLQNMRSALGSTHFTDILYFRRGTYTFDAEWQFDPPDWFMVFDNGADQRSPYTWLAYPGETVTLTGSSANGYYPGALFSDMYLDGLTFNGFAFNAIAPVGSKNYITIRRCKFSNLNVTTSTNVNQGFIFIRKGSSKGSYLTIQDNEFSNFRSGQAIGSLYTINKALIENNNIHDGGQVNPGAVQYTEGIGIKIDSNRVTVRGNRINMPAYIPIAAYQSHTNMEIANNLIVRNSSINRGMALQFFSLNSVYVHHNTIVGDISFRKASDTTYCSGTCGPFYFNNNVIVNTNTSFTDGDGTYYSGTGNFSYFTFFTGINITSFPLVASNNLLSTTTTNVLDSNYNLINRDLVGTYGWEIGSAPPISSPKSLQLQIIK